MSTRASEGGQILPLFAILLVGIIAMLALSIDVSLPTAPARVIGPRLMRPPSQAGRTSRSWDPALCQARSTTQRERMPWHPFIDQFHYWRHWDLCPDSANRGLYAGRTPFHVSITTPLPSAADCVSCDPERSIKVTVNNPTFALRFARVLGIGNWNVGVGSVAGLSFEKSYAVITLRPPKKIGSTFDVNDIVLAGGSQITVNTGDVGNNSNMNYTNSGGPTPSKMFLDPGYRFFYYPAAPPDNDPGWVPPLPASPVGVPHTQPITDPNYTYPALIGSRGTATTLAMPEATQWATLPAVDRADNPDVGSAPPRSPR